MNRYADPAVCPGCHAALEPGTPECPHCGIRLTGQAAAQLFSTLMRADQLVAELRRPVAVPTGGPAANAPFPAASRPVPTPRLTSASVPRILLGLGAVCLLVAALVFLAVAWSAMGVGGRTAVLVALTALATGLGTWSARRELRAGAESFSVVGLGLLALDLSGANSSGWFGDLSAEHFLVLLGTALALAGVAAAVVVRRTAIPRLVGAELVASLGVLTACAGWVAAEHTSPAAGLLAASVVSAGAAVLAHRRRLVFLAAGAAAGAGLWWVALFGRGLVDAIDEPTVSWLWLHGRIWPLLAAATLAGLPGLVRRLPLPLRLASAAGAVAVLAIAVGVTSVGDSGTVKGVVMVLVLAAALALALLAPGRWGWSSVGALVLSATGTLVLVAALAATAVERLADEPWSRAAGARLDGPAPDASPLLVLPGILLLLIAVWSVRRLLGIRSDLSGLLGWCAAPAVLGVAGTLALEPTFRWAVVAVLVTGAVATWWWSARSEHDVARGAGLAALGLAAALPSDWLTAATLLVLTGLALVLDQRGPDRVWGVPGSAPVVPLLGALVWTTGHLALLPEDWAAALVIAVVGLMALARPVPTYELGAGASATAAVLAAGPDLGWLAVHLTLAGTLVTASALVHRRRDLGWVGSGLLLAATWVRLVDLDVTTVEAYTLPLAASLLGFGLYRMRTDRAVGTLTALSPSLVLALVPSLLLSLEDPVSTRALLLGLGCLAVVAVGVGLHWNAPLLIGAATGLLLVLREAAWAQVLPQWVVIGLVGTLLTVAGVTWERRLQELRVAAGYLRALR